MRFLINIALLLGLVLGLPFFAFKMLTAGKYRRGLGQRFGSLPFPPPDKPTIWVHAVSVGELQLAEPLVKSLVKQYPDHQVVISHTTRTGEEVAARLYPDLPRFYSPLDFSFVLGRVFRRLKPALIVLVELELWPNFLLEAKRRGVPVLLANGRISARSANGYGRNAWFMSKPFSAIRIAAVQNQEYADRLSQLWQAMKLDPSNIRLAGNLKFDRAPEQLDVELRASWRRRLGVQDGEVLLVCGSTHPGEHEHLPSLYRKWHDAGAQLRMVVVPRHPERYGAVREAFKSADVTLLNRSDLPDAGPAASQPGALPPVVMLDTMGELSALYQAADIAFIGGSLIPHGGQNMIEPAALGLPVIVGPHTLNFASVMRELKRASAVIEVQDLAGLESAVKSLVAGPERRREIGEPAREVVQAGRGSLARHMELVREIMAR